MSGVDKRVRKAQPPAAKTQPQSLATTISGAIAALLIACSVVAVNRGLDIWSWVNISQWPALPWAYQAQDSTLSYGPIHFEGNANYLYRDSLTACQVIISDTTSNKPTRFITAFPNGNTGALMYFEPVNGRSLGVTLGNDTLKSVTEQYGQVGVSGTLSVSGDFQVGTTIIGSVRAIRDYLEGGGVQHPEFNYSLGEYSESSAQLVRKWINGSTVQLVTLRAVDNVKLKVRPSDNDQPPSIHILRHDKAKNGTLTFTSTLNFTTTTPETPYVKLEGLDSSQLFREPASDDDIPSKVVKAITSHSPGVVDQMSFLTYQDVFFAGGWRFLTYFGRDTLFTLQLLMPVMSERAAEAVLAAVIQRTGASGELCHEETFGDYASFLHMQEGQPELGNTPIYVYTMVDTDFLLLPVLADYLTSKRGAPRAAAFLGRQSTLVPGSFKDLLLRNIDHVLEMTKPFADNPARENLIGIRAYPVGNWRDSHAGLGWGTYPFDVNCAFIPAALAAISRLAEAGLISSEYSHASAASKIWGDNACPMFAVSLSSEEAKTKLISYIKESKLPNSLLFGAGSLNSSQTVSTHQSYGWTDSDQTIGLTPEDSTIFALALMEDYTPIPILHSDLSFSLLYSRDISPALIQATIESLQPYPRGLLTNVGMVVANAAYDSNATRIPEFSDAAYHGAVAWSWTQGMMAAGVARQLELCGVEASGVTDPFEVGGFPAGDTGTRPAWCATHAKSLQQAQTRLWDSIAGSKEVLWTEVWSPVYTAETGVFEISDLGTRGDGTEGDAVQLWSYGFLGLVDPRSGRPVAAGFGG